MVSRWHQLLLSSKPQPLNKDMVRSKQQIPNLLQLAKLSSLVSLQTTAPQANAIKTPQSTWMPFGEAVRGYISINPCHTSNHGKTANVNELVNSHAAADHGPGRFFAPAVAVTC